MRTAILLGRKQGLTCFTSSVLKVGEEWEKEKDLKKSTIKSAREHVVRSFEKLVLRRMLLPVITVYENL